MKANRIIFVFEKWVVVVIFVFMFTVTFAQVIARYFFNIGWAWVPEMVVYGLINITLIGASTGVISGVHIGVDIIVKLLPEKYEVYSRIFANFCGIVLYLFMSYLSLRFVLYFKDMDQHSIITGFPIWLMIVFMPGAFFLMAVHYVESLWGIWHKPQKTDLEHQKIRI
jgi:C4-dicarboxylate transporter DctQ subunit